MSVYILQSQNQAQNDEKNWKIFMKDFMFKKIFLN